MRVRVGHTPLNHANTHSCCLIFQSEDIMRLSQPFQSKNKLPKEPVPFIYFLGLLETSEWIINLLGGELFRKKVFYGTWLCCWSCALRWKGITSINHPEPAVITDMERVAKKANSWEAEWGISPMGVKIKSDLSLEECVWWRKPA